MHLKQIYDKVAMDLMSMLVEDNLTLNIIFMIKTEAKEIRSASDQISKTRFVTELIRVGEEGIEPGDENVMNAYFADDYIFHGPGGDMTFTELKDFWKVWRSALSNFTLTREQIVVQFLIAFIFPIAVFSQTTPYSELSIYSDEYSAGKVAARAVDGLGFRFYWATENLREADLSFKPGTDARTSLETVAHIYEMSFIIMNSVKGKVNVEGQDVKLPFAEMRTKTLENLKAASDILMKSSDADMRTYKALFNRNGKTVERSFWNVINGPIEDCVWHVGQIVSFRRSSGNPINEKVNVFTGKVEK